MKNRVLTLAIVATNLFSSTVFAQAFVRKFDSSSANPREMAMCQLGDKDFRVVVSGIGRVFEEEEATFGSPIISIQAGKSNHVLSTPGGEKEGPQYKLAGRSRESLCVGTPAYAIDVSKAVIFFNQDNRPFHEKTSFSVYDASTDKVVFTKLDAGSFSNWQKRGSRFFFEEAVPRSDVDGGEVTIAGQKFTYADKDLIAAQTIVLVGDRAEVRADFEESHSKWRYIVRDGAEFSKLAGWDATTWKFKNHVAYVARSNDGKKICVQYWDRRAKLDELKARGWTCTK